MSLVPLSKDALDMFERQVQDSRKLHRVVRAVVLSHTGVAAWLEPYMHAISDGIPARYPRYSQPGAEWGVLLYEDRRNRAVHVAVAPLGAGESFAFEGSIERGIAPRSYKNPLLNYGNQVDVILQDGSQNFHFTLAGAATVDPQEVLRRTWSLRATFCGLVTFRPGCIVQGSLEELTRVCHDFFETPVFVMSRSGWTEQGV